MEYGLGRLPKLLSTSTLVLLTGLPEFDILVSVHRKKDYETITDVEHSGSSNEWSDSWTEQPTTVSAVYLSAELRHGHAIPAERSAHP